MLRSSLFGFSLTLLLAASPFAAIAPAHAGPAYTSDTVIDLFSKDKATKGLGGKRSICIDDGSSNCKASGDQPAPATFDLLVTFEFGSDKLTPAARENLSQFAKALLDPRLKGSKFEVDGHTDATGAEDYNLGLSERRAKAVVEYLAGLGVDPGTLAAHGWGKTKPRVSDPYSPENRRVETHLID